MGFLPELFLSLLLFWQPAGQTKSVTVHLNPAKTQIRWTLTDVLHTVHGTFALKSGTITFDPETGAAEGEIVVETESGQSGDGMRDRRMKREILETQKYPEAVFRPEKVRGTLQPDGSATLMVDGTFTIHGSSHPLTLTVQTQMQGAQQVTATTHFAVPYVAWGMKDPSTFVLRVQKQVDVDVTAAGTVDEAEAETGGR
jgi:polyisoprenoid-binding protein YceI